MMIVIDRALDADHAAEALFRIIIFIARHGDAAEVV